MGLDPYFGEILQGRPHIDLLSEHGISSFKGSLCRLGLGKVGVNIFPMEHPQGICRDFCLADVFFVLPDLSFSGCQAILALWDHRL